MANEDMLLRMLEPAVRPAGVPAPQREAHRPIESQSFEELLREARIADAKPIDSADAATDADAAASQPSPASRLLAQLGSIDRILNPDIQQAYNAKQDTDN